MLESVGTPGHLLQMTLVYTHFLRRLGSPQVSPDLPRANHRTRDQPGPYTTLLFL
ncbi:hypothetical protein J3R74_003208 [Puniceicoccus vermicola]